MGEQRSGVEQFAAVDLLPLIGGAVGRVALRRQRVRWRAQAEHVEEEPLVVALPAVRDETASPARQPWVSVGPPSRAQFQSARRYSASARRRTSASSGRVAVEVGGDRSARLRTGTPSRSWTARTSRHDGRCPCPGSGSRSPCSRWRPARGRAGCRGGYGVGGGRSSPELPDDDAALNDDRNRRQRQADRGDAGRERRIGFVPNQSVVRVGLVQVVQDGCQLQPAEFLVRRQPIQVVFVRRWLVDHRSPPSRQPSSTRTSWARPSSTSGIAIRHGLPSTVTVRTPRPVPAGFSTRMR